MQVTEMRAERTYKFILNLVPILYNLLSTVKLLLFKFLMDSYAVQDIAMSELESGCGVGFSPFTLTEDEFISRNNKKR